MEKVAKVVCSALALSMLTFAPISISAETKPETVYVAKEKKSLKQTIDKIIEPYSKNIDIGIKVVSLKDGKLLYQHDEDKKLMPASCLKLITSLVSLKKLGLNYTFKTEFYKVGDDIYVKGYGDPYLVSEQLWLITKELKHKGIKEINNIIADESYFDDKKYSPGWHEETNKEDKSKAYSAPSGALSLNFNTIVVHVKASEKLLDNPVITLDPETEYLEIDNQAKTYQNYDGTEVSRGERNEKDVLTISGGIQKGEEKIFRVNVSKPAEYFLTVFKDFLEKEGINVKGNLKKGLVPEQAEIILTHESKPLSLIVRDLCKYSSNFVADQITKTLDAELNQKQGSLEGGVEIIKDYLNKLGLKDFEIVDGSGYSVKNRITAGLITKVLEESYKDFEIFPEFIAAQPIAGQDGTLQDRMSNAAVRAKTGLLNDTGVSSISGYAKTKDDEILAFSIIMYSKEIKAWQMQNIQDMIIEELTGYSIKK